MNDFGKDKTSGWRKGIFNEQLLVCVDCRENNKDRTKDAIVRLSCSCIGELIESAVVPVPFRPEFSTAIGEYIICSGT